eukprot:949444-Pyramimonas_sp.AAC.1
MRCNAWGPIPHGRLGRSLMSPGWVSNPLWWMQQRPGMTPNREWAKYVITTTCLCPILLGLLSPNYLVA